MSPKFLACDLLNDKKKEGVNPCESKARETTNFPVVQHGVSSLWPEFCLV